MSGETKTEAVTRALRDRLARLRQERTGRGLAEELEEIAAHCSQLPVRDERRAGDPLPFDADGLPR